MVNITIIAYFIENIDHKNNTSIKLTKKVNSLPSQLFANPLGKLALGLPR